MSTGRFFGPHNPYHDTKAKTLTPDSATVGMSGAAAARLRLVKPSALILAPCAIRSEERTGSCGSCILPHVRPVIVTSGLSNALNHVLMLGARIGVFKPR